jgi:hypothetical protein
MSQRNPPSHEDTLSQRRLALLRAIPWFLASAAVTLALLACSEQRPSTPATLMIPTRIGITTTDLGGVYDAVAAYAADAGFPANPSQSSKAQGTLVSQRVRCSPNGDERHTAWCVFRFAVAPMPNNILQTAVTIRVDVPERVDYDATLALHQVRIEPTLDKLVAALTARFPDASVAQTDPLVF